MGTWRWTCLEDAEIEASPLISVRRHVMLSWKPLQTTLFMHLSAVVFHEPMNTKSELPKINE